MKTLDEICEGFLLTCGGGGRFRPAENTWTVHRRQASYRLSRCLVGIRRPVYIPRDSMKGAGGAGGRTDAGKAGHRNRDWGPGLGARDASAFPAGPFPQRWKIRPSVFLGTVKPWSS